MPILTALLVNCARTTSNPANAPQILTHTGPKWNERLPYTPTVSDPIPPQLQQYQQFPPALRLRHQSVQPKRLYGLYIGPSDLYDYI